MICPFRIDVEFDYIALAPKDDENAEPSYLEKAQRQKYPECMEEECPFYEYSFNVTGSCNRIGDD